MIKSFLYSKNKLSSYNLSELKSENSLKRKKETLLIVVKNPTKENTNLLQKKFNIHPTTIEDISSPLTRIKYEEFENNTFLVFKGIRSTKKNIIRFYTFYIIDGDRYVVLAYYKDNDTIEQLISDAKKLEAFMKKGEDYVVHYVIDKEIDKYLIMKENISEDLKDIEKEFMKKPTKDILNSLFIKEKIILEVSQRLESITDVCLRLKKPTENFIQNELIPYFRDVYDHSFKTHESLKTYLERINSIRNSYLSLTSNRMNETIKILTIITAIIMPMTFITGFYGMNIQLPAQNHVNAYILLISLMLVTIVIMLLLFKKMGLIWQKY